MQVHKDEDGYDEDDVDDDDPNDDDDEYTCHS